MLALETIVHEITINLHIIKIMDCKMNHILVMSSSAEILSCKRIYRI